MKHSASTVCTPSLDNGHVTGSRLLFTCQPGTKLSEVVIFLLQRCTELLLKAPFAALKVKLTLLSLSLQSSNLVAEGRQTGLPAYMWTLSS